MIIYLLCFFFFFFQAEDGIRDAQESRGLGDVYKRQVLDALELAVGCCCRGNSANLRMLNYPGRPASSEPQSRHGEHIDFGTFTINYTTGPGLQVMHQDEWWDVPVTPPSSAALFFGLLTQVRSNHRVPAALHRVIDAGHEADGEVAQRHTATLFVVPRHVDMAIEPAVMTAQEQRYPNGLKVGNLIPGFAASFPKSWWLDADVSNYPLLSLIHI
eukprot:TRINITY_DN49497_c0_g1_i2.p1 TRINITY_DN49497_c0_g1~~TRINITY_DN49497_c0_g1_i2.p1  ORF type:complete len:215 (-),score=39.03 TRINITY_DN49497_c0_g1_i2:119-763(-)